jgi:uncharacterized protein YecE (DUF72 family)
MPGRTHVGISGWRYPAWRGVFYPKGLPHPRGLAHASRLFGSIEINGTFYSLQRAAWFDRWRSQVQPGFVFSVKGSRFITHLKKLRDTDVAMANFFAQGLLRLRDTLGPILWQLPPSLGFHEDRLESFLGSLPRDTDAAARLARGHDGRVKDPWTKPPSPARRLRHALEVRHATFIDPRFVALLRRQDVGLVVADTAGRWPLLEDVTSDFVYVRLHGDEELYVSGYTDAALGFWAIRIRSWLRGCQPRDARLVAPRAPRSLRGRDVFAYFDNDVKVHAPFDAMALQARLVRGRQVEPAHAPLPSDARAMTIAGDRRWNWEKRAGAVRSGRDGPG